MPDAGEIKRIRSASLVTSGTGKKTFGQGSLEVRNGLRVLRLRGSHYETGYQHGILLREEIRHGVGTYYGNPMENFAPFKHMSVMKRYLVKMYFDWKIYRPLMKATPKHYLSEMKGIADGSGLTFAEIFHGNMYSELNMNLVKVLEQEYFGQVASACTTFVAFNEATTDGALIMGRNTDYSGGGLWDKYQTVMIYEPKDAYRFVNLSSAGIIKCNSCMNEKKICIGAHFLPLNDTTPHGISLTYLELEIMKRASSIDEAIAIIKGNPRVGAFAFTLADGKTNGAAVVECSASKVGVRRADGNVIWETNVSTTNEIKPVDVLLRNGIGKNPIARFERMRTLMQENMGKINPQVAAKIMGDHMDMCSGTIRPAGGIIAQVINLTSAVFRPATLDFWAAHGPTPMCHNAYTGFNLMQELDGKGSSVEPAILDPNDYVQSDSYKALRKYHEALVSSMVPPTDEEAALKRLEEAIALKPDEAIYRRIVSQMLIRKGDAAKATEHLRRAIECEQSRNELAQTYLFFGFANDLAGKRNEAIKCYEKVLQMADSGEANVLADVNPLVIADAGRRLKVPFRPKDAT
ncbi:MAG: hypothetical protein HY801_04480, partial [Candidatus Lindowbacteria bacterium]|nr:hypothetical protein [Candidatus Lindowbacteria bacterium]